MLSSSELSASRNLCADGGFDGCRLIRVVVAEGWGGYGSFLK
jgi:hypothetical protein